MKKCAIYLALLMSLITLSLLSAACGGSDGENDNSGISDGDESESPQSIPIEDKYGDQGLSAEQEKLIFDALHLYAYNNHRSLLLLNSAFMADFKHTPVAVINARLNAAYTALNEYYVSAKLLNSLESEIIMPVVEELNSAEAKLVKKESADSSDFAHTYRLIDLYMNDDSFYQKYRLSDISKKTGVSIARLMIMVQQASEETEKLGYDQEDELYQEGVRNMQTIRDTAIAAEGAIATFGPMGATAGALTTFQKGVAVVEKANAVISCAEASSNIIATSLGNETASPTLQTVFGANKALGYILLPGSVAKGGLDTVLAIGGTMGDLEDKYFNINADNQTVTLQDTPENPEADPLDASEALQDADHFLAPGDYQISTEPMGYPTEDNSGFEFNDDINPENADDLNAEYQRLADLWDLPGATSDQYSWDTEEANPQENFQPYYSDGPPEDSPVAGDQAVVDVALSDYPALTLTASPSSGAAPLGVAFTVTVSDPVQEALEYHWHFGNGSSAIHALSSEQTTYENEGTYYAVVYAYGALFGSAMAKTEIVVGQGVEDGDMDSFEEDQDSGEDDSGIVAATWTDADTGLTWENPNTNTSRVNYEGAMDYCENLVLNSLDDWRLPTIGELRNLIRNCPETETSGACGVSDSCSELSCRNDACDGCSFLETCRWNPALVGECDAYWSSTHADEINAWLINFGQAYIFAAGINSWGTVSYARCVR